MRDEPFDHLHFENGSVTIIKDGTLLAVLQGAQALSVKCSRGPAPQGAVLLPGDATLEIVFHLTPEGKKAMMRKEFADMVKGDPVASTVFAVPDEEEGCVTADDCDDYDGSGNCQGCAAEE